MLRRCIPEGEQRAILDCFHGSDYGSYFSGKKTAWKVPNSGFFWPSLFKDAALWAKSCDKCQRTGNISWWNDKPLQGVLEIEILDVWGMDLSMSFGNHYILLAVDYVSKWI